MKLAVLNQKGGTGKTTSAIHLATGLARRGHSVLLIDVDPQGSCAISFAKENQGLNDVLEGKSTLSERVQNIERGLDLLAGGPSLLDCEHQLHQNAHQISRLFQSRIDTAKYSMFVMDLAPARSLLNRAALYFATDLLIPVACDYLSLVGVRDILDFAESINSTRETPLCLRGLLPVFFDQRSKVSREGVQILEKHFPHKVFDAIRWTTKAKEAPSHGKTLFDYAPRSHAAMDYQALVDRFATLDSLH